jgi:hypothetical protein
MTRQTRSACFSSFSEELSNSANVAGRGTREQAARTEPPLSRGTRADLKARRERQAVGWLKAKGGQRVGTGVVDRYGGEPVDKWENTINCLRSERFKDVVRGLISGQLVRSDDEEVQISFRWVTDTRLNIRIREADTDIEDILIDLVVEAVDPGGLDRDQRGLATPVPDGWMAVQSETTSDWELYNCRIHSLDPTIP